MQQSGENVGLRVVKCPLTLIDRAIVGKDSSSTIARIFWSLTVVGRRTPWTARPRIALLSGKTGRTRGRSVKTHLDEWDNCTFSGLPRVLSGRFKSVQKIIYARHLQYMHILLLISRSILWMLHWSNGRWAS